MPEGIETTDQSTATTAVDIVRIEKLEATNAALTRELRHLKQSSAKDLEGAVAKHLTPLQEQLAALAAARTEAPEKPAGESSELARAHARIKEMERKMAEADARSAAAVAAQLVQEERAQLGAQLAAMGIDGPRQRMAIALLHTESKCIVRDGQVGIGMKVKRNGYEEVVPLEEGLKEWATTDEGRALLPARGVSGSGTRPGPRAQTRMPVADKHVYHDGDRVTLDNADDVIRRGFARMVGGGE
jgi:hypothetical protein